MQVFEVAPDDLRAHNVSVYLASDHDAAKTTAADLAHPLGFTPVDFGALRFSGMLEALSDIVRHSILQGAPLSSSISIVRLPHPSQLRLGGRAASKLL